MIAPESAAIAVPESAQPPLLEVRDLKVHFPFVRGHLFGRQRGVVRAVDGVSLQLAEGETLGLVGESGCGKSTLARGILRLVRPTAGEVWFAGRRIDNVSRAEMRQVRSGLQMIFQDPFASLNPRMTVGRIVAEPMEVGGLYNREHRRLEVMRLLELVGLNPRFLNRYPHEFSGGQRQRIGIARALAVNPRVILCDEPVSALDVSIQAQIVNLLQDLQQQLGLSYIFIAHDLSVVRHIADRVGVMYLGRLVEVADSRELYEQPRHPYTRALLESVPIPDPVRERQRSHHLLGGEVPSPDREYPGCQFADRCPRREEKCDRESPGLEGESHAVACWYPLEENATHDGSTHDEAGGRRE
ncbi:MAG: ATP-binding cassette domain-containing protein [Planctomycetota bacterium]|nr:MAG: ATP-binding cassette domain-containing protein [Planctomycetota bacterium]REJ87118.1 MAG: ATP-binding cassette domain-containing protein [Planctomycetota bacterium]REK26964.1 MAG: ATP-binding cassette domain-containing protein [Planctomycetota bacterium]REK44320.1 MAG: ATP-binding cassette domain-containing protein [Planctomycetota bacterium]